MLDYLGLFVLRTRLIPLMLIDICFLYHVEARFLIDFASTWMLLHEECRPALLPFRMSVHEAPGAPKTASRIQADASMYLSARIPIVFLGRASRFDLERRMDHRIDWRARS